MAPNNRWIKAIKFIYSLLFPSFCLNCGQEGPYICDKCSLFLIESENPFQINCLLKNGQDRLPLDRCLIVWESNAFFDKIRNIIYSQKAYHVLEYLSEKALKIFLNDPKLNSFWLAWFDSSTKIIAVNSPEENKKNFPFAKIIIDKFIKLTDRDNNLSKTLNQKNIILVSFCWHEGLLLKARALKDKNSDFIWVLVLTGKPC